MELDEKTLAPKTSPKTDESEGKEPILALKMTLLEEKDKYAELSSKYQILKIKYAKLEGDLAEQTKEKEKLSEQKLKNNQVSATKCNKRETLGLNKY